MNKFSDISKLPLPPGLKLRDWQGQFLLTFLNKCVAENNPFFLLEAAPGTGKTIGQFCAAYILYKKQLVKWIIVVVPTDHLRSQVGEEVDKVFALDLYYETGSFPREDYDGEVITYAQLAANPNIYKQRCDSYNGKVIVVGDEIHHLGDRNSWSQAFKTAFSGVVYFLFTSGTPFRSDNQKILAGLINYKLVELGKYISDPDYSYGYAKAVRGKVVRPVIFPAYEGEFTWQRNGSIHTKSFGEASSKLELADAFATALYPEGGWLETTLTQANSQLMQIRSQSRADAAGILFCIDISHAQRCAKTLEKVTGVYPVVVTNDDKAASANIAAFAQASGAQSPAWIVTVKMVSEGVNIPRLQVGVYASNVLTEMFFRQVIGRIIRVIDKDKNEIAFFYFPAHPTLIEYAIQIKQERCHEVQESDKEAPAAQRQNGNGCGSGSSHKIESGHSAILSTGYEAFQLFDGHPFTPADLAEAQAWKSELDSNAPLAQIAALLRGFRRDVHNNDNHNGSNGNGNGHGNKNTENGNDQQVNVNCEPEPNAPTSSPRKLTKTDRIKVLKRQINKRAYRLSCLRGVQASDIHTQWMSLGNNSNEQSTETELIQKRDWIEQQISLVCKQALSDKLP